MAKEMTYSDLQYMRLLDRKLIIVKQELDYWDLSSLVSTEACKIMAKLKDEGKADKMMETIAEVFLYNATTIEQLPDISDIDSYIRWDLEKDMEGGK